MPQTRLLAGALAGVFLTAAAAPGALDAAFGSTIVSTYPDGRTAELYLQRDGGYTARGRRGDGSSGRWKQDGDKLCLSQSNPLPSPFPFCTPIPSDLHGAWSAKAVTGEAIRVKLVKGHFAGSAKPAPSDAGEKPAGES